MARGRSGRGKRNHFNLLDRYIRRIDALAPREWEWGSGRLWADGRDARVGSWTDAWSYGWIGRWGRWVDGYKG